MQTKKLEDLSTLVSLCKQRGFVFQSSEIYGGLNSCWDYGPLGSQMLLNVKMAWWKAMTRRADVVGLDASILMAPMVWKASGHVDGFTDPLVDCKDCRNRFRADNTESYLERKECPSCKSKNLTEPRNFNLMFKTHMGPLDDDSSIVYLRPETAQGIFVNFENVASSGRKKVPFGIAQIGKSFRNEITPGNFIFRTREFEQMEMQFFVRPGEDEATFEKWKATRLEFYKDLGVNTENLRFHEHVGNELAHYAKAAFDIQYKFPMGWEELEGIHNRSDFDLKQHQEFSKKKLEYFDPETNQKYLPYVIETAVGCGRMFMTFLCDSYREEVTEKEGKTDTRVVLGLHPEISPVKVGILPLSKKAPLRELSLKIHDDLTQDFNVDYDESQSIGKRYRRQDEIGTPFCLTVDFDSLEDQKVTIRHRDTMDQDRVDVSQVSQYVKDGLKEKF